MAIFTLIKNASRGILFLNMPKLKVPYTSLATKFTETKSLKMGINDEIQFLYTHTYIYI
jgi:hypothetical protein